MSRLSRTSRTTPATRTNHRRHPCPSRTPSTRTTARKAPNTMSTADGIAQLAAQLAQLVQTLAEQNHQPIETAAARAMPERTLLTAEEAADRLGIGRTFMF